MNGGEQFQCAWVKLFHPSGADVRLPLDTTAIIPVDGFRTILQSVSNALEAGFTVAIVGAEEGEQIEEIGSVVRADVDSRDGGSVPRIDLYLANERTKYRAVSVYLNTDADIKAFEAVSGLSVRQLPPYVGQGYIERGKSTQTDKLIIKAPHTFRAAFIPNPKYDPAETDISKKKPARLFSRWPDWKGGASSVDGGGSGPENVSKPEYDMIMAKVADAEASIDKILDHYKINSLSNLPKSEYPRLISLLEKRIKEVQAKRAAESAQASNEIPF